MHGDKLKVVSGAQRYHATFILWPRRVLPPSESYCVCSDGTDRHTDGWSPNRYITRLEHSNAVN